jgi:hypothetical protein
VAHYYNDRGRGAIGVHDPFGAHIREKKAWAAPASILLSIIVVFVTADFKEAFGVQAATWRAVFMIVGFLSPVSTIRAVRAAVRAPSVDEFVNVL